jgi:hypothetical protein
MTEDASGMTAHDALSGASAHGVGQNFFDLFSGEKILVRGVIADAPEESPEESPKESPKE